MSARDTELVGLRQWLRNETNPQHKAELFVLISRKLRHAGLFDQAKSVIEAGAQMFPDNALILRSYGLELFRFGEIAKGIGFYDKGRWQLTSFDKYRRPFSFPFWQGENLTGKRLLVWAEQGIGDQIMHARVLDTLIAQGAKVTVESDIRLHGLLKHRNQIKCFQQFDTPIAELAKQPFDFQTSMFSAWRFVEDPLANSDAIECDGKLSALYQNAWKKMGNALDVGLSWHSKAAATGADRSLDLALLRPLTDPKIARFHSLQYGAPDLSETGRALGAPILNDPQSDPLKDLRRQVAQIAALDLVITIDNATAHIAGALGKPCWVLLPKASEWRWGTSENPIELYPSVRCFRTENLGDWSAALWQLFDAFEDQFITSDK